MKCFFGWVGVVVGAAAACGDGGGATQMDASIDAAPVDPNATFTCVGVPWPTTTTDPLHIGGKIVDATITGGGNGIGGAPYEIVNADTDVVLASGATGATSLSRGGYGADIATGGVPQKIYRHFAATGTFLEAYAWDPMAQFAEFSFQNPIPDQAYTDAIYQRAGLTYDATKAGIVVHIVDCKLPTSPGGPHAVVGATVDAPPGASLLYVDDTGEPNATLTKTGMVGQVAILNVTPGIVDVTVHAGDVTYRPWPINVRANTFNWSPRHP